MCLALVIGDIMTPKMKITVGKKRASNVVSKLKEGYLAKKRRESRQFAPEGSQYYQPPPYYPPQKKGESKEEKEKKKKELEMEKGGKGIEISGISETAVSVPLAEGTHDHKEDISVSYNLVPRSPKRGETVYAYASIKWNPRLGEAVYYVVEPKITKGDLDTVESVKRFLEEKLDVDFIKLGDVKGKQLLSGEVQKILGTMPEIPETKKGSLNYYIERDIVGLGRIEALMNDPNIEDISCDGLNIPIYVYHRDPKIGSLKTNVMFKDDDELNTFVTKIAQKCKKSISISEPLLDATLPDGSRIQATLGTDIARRGSNFTIRKFTEQPLTPTHMIKYGTLDPMQLAYLWLAIENGMSILISGGTATGKTSLLNALSLFIRPNLKIVSIEDTAELRLPHPHWIPEVARTPLSMKGSKGEVTLFDLLKSSLRQRPDYIIMGEVRGKEAFVLFQQMASIPGYEKVRVLNDDHLKSIGIGELKDNKTYRLPTADLDSRKIEISRLKMRVEHPPTKTLYKITTKTGREVITTGNHSVFTYSKNIEPVVVDELKEGSNIIIPAELPCGFNDVEYLDMMELLPDIRVYSPTLIKKASKKIGFEKASRITGYACISHYYGVNNCALPAEKFIKLMKEADISYKSDRIEVRFDRRSELHPAKLKITPEFLRFLGYFISEGSINRAHKNNSVSLYNNNKEILDDMRKCIESVTGKGTRERETKGYGRSTELTFSHKTIFELLRRFCYSGNMKKVPEFIFGLSKKKIGHFLSGLYSGDAQLKRDSFTYYTISRELANDVTGLLLTLGIVTKIRKRDREGRKNIDYELVFYRKDYMDEFLKYVNPVGKKFGLKEHGRSDPNVMGDLYVDAVKKIEKMVYRKNVPIFDLSVPGTQNFIGGFGGVLLHNTGHPSLATMHAASVGQLIDRLTTPPISLPPSLLENINIIVFLVLSRLKDRYVRRSNSVMEITGIKDQLPVTRQIFKWKPAEDSYQSIEKSSVLHTISLKQGLSVDAVKDELIRRRSILEWMLNREIYNYKDVARVISVYYANPKRIMDLVSSRA